jgi:ubiquinone/menaquinone biosynthesis C-methylase UbiE
VNLQPVGALGRHAPGHTGARTVPGEYVPGFTASAYQAHMRAFPRFADALPGLPDDGQSGIRGGLSTAGAPGNEFDDDVTGRGDSYRVSQRSPLVRATGINTLFRRAVEPLPEVVPADFRVLDVLGGDGTIARALAAQGGPGEWILTGDLSASMVAQALRYGLPAICQPAQRLAVRDASFDAILLAYGTHHIPPVERKNAYLEAWRALKPGGRLLVHDFAQDGPVAAWFGEVVHRYAPNGHEYEHFTGDELVRDLESAGLEEVAVEEMYDPFVVSGETAEQAVEGLTDYVASMYGLFGLTREAGWQERLWQLMDTLLRYPDGSAPITRLTVHPAEDGPGWTAVMPRVALLAVGTKRG